MAKLKRLLIDWFWPDRTTFLTKGRRYGLMSFALASCIMLGGIAFALVINRLITTEVNPFMSDLIVRLESASQGNGQATAADLKKAAAALDLCRREINSLPTFFLPLLLFAFCLVCLASGICWLRAHQAVSRALQPQTPESPSVDA